ncbi:MAG: T9SS type A sorting domain-containing protein, partial [bacterium]
SGFGELVDLPNLHTEPSSLVPRHFALYQNYPNPFNPSTTIRFDVPRDSEVQIRIFNILGQVVKVLTDKKYKTGQYEIIWQGTNEQNVPIASGVYLILMKADDFRLVKKTLLLR